MMRPIGNIIRISLSRLAIKMQIIYELYECATHDDVNTVTCLPGAARLTSDKSEAVNPIFTPADLLS